MTTFSQAVDAAVLETHRPDLRTEICRYLNQTIREVHFEPSKGNVVIYNGNYREIQITTTALERQTWVNPYPHLFQQEVAVRFDNAYLRDGRRVYARRVTPGPNMELEDFYYYRAGDTFVFGGLRGYGGVGATISMAYYEYPRSLNYYDPDVRPATFDSDHLWQYLDDFVQTEESQEQARFVTTNWLLMRWKDVIEEGLRAKIYKRISDDPRARTCYSLYMQLRQGLYTSEVADLTGYR